MLIVQLAHLDTAEVNYSLLSTQIINDAELFNGRRKKQFLVCRSILASLLNQYCQIDILPTMVIGDNHRPCFLNTNLPDFNISHSQDWVAVAISLNGSIGLDIEVDRPRKNYLDVAKNFFSDAECQWMMKQADTLKAFWQLWTLKESALKLYAKGVWQIKSVKVDIDKKLISAPFGQHFYYQYQQVASVHLAVNHNKPITELILQS
ncbi:4'-phosphopantetheinyl transferase superfamily protein [Gilliamella sp. B2776]|uniref:4'-phosphopantetheinyl transferase family protein n=1 Tax=unclassified Gilliamella TaxID=2685620 RepID=UPI00226AD79F|nr:MULTISPECIES: 4'-phosphopantetheinyl transferase superfamily protein [unclassified Gilliamella]MCX8649865.1 4'-phosphopantetheinyl transferase superfamily protein [Gilliamella sp. B2779]MCX8653624.1 4'-phosphopantetheinyl transferase superfamily protein [Gilliamella sp. B2737]MCX8656185.1 4'-phosphopantetheinyl transferase superfamily protein [Gilliamella sp. B2894]MCX8664507.1 4'-phosphopantetheinyl transferase superfamily protein [Gilliamella sp. B2887]MCX8691638.1 4'-phosphopantetheinyl 